MIKEIPKDLLAAELAEIYASGRQPLALALAKVTNFYSIKFVNYELENLEDENTPVAGELYQ